ncbi:heme-binding domain-containing protein [Tenacibaculum maritimum]|uniref:heme-binding domain-containing protein n=1 Tax=Tenacibaculum maritimum TaxID=107401 RepID=UPI0012E67958|nr:heme-binding domain-containing protein [Tenacibaculum maritimum]CAA0171145.1 conserved hypothetical protein [Tenacibaculum maritimum]
MDQLFSRVIIQRFLAILFSSFILIQLYRPKKNDAGFIKEHDFLEIVAPPKEVGTLIKRACYDCHSNNTDYKWFDNIAPISWWVDLKIERAKFSLNFSEWKNLDTWRRLSFLSASAHDIRTGRMPTKAYLKFHPDAALSPLEKNRIIQWLESVNRFDNSYDYKTINK